MKFAAKMEATRFAYWWGLPWRCKLRHRPVVIDGTEWYEGTRGPVERWRECERCENFLGLLR